jgi:hypothetical protein
MLKHRIGGYPPSYFNRLSGHGEGVLLNAEKLRVKTVEGQAMSSGSHPGGMAIHFQIPK